MSAAACAANLVMSVSLVKERRHEDVVQASAAALALFHGGLYWAYTRLRPVFLPFALDAVHRPMAMA